MYCFVPSMTTASEIEVQNNENAQGVLGRSFMIRLCACVYAFVGGRLLVAGAVLLRPYSRMADL